MMLYMLRAGVLYHQTHILAHIKGRFSDPEKKIFAADGTLLFQTAIHTMNAPPGKNGDVRFREYRLLNPDGSIYATARPGYLTQDDPDVVGWPLCRMPKVDHAVVDLAEKKFLLVMQNSQNYLMERSDSSKFLQVLHRGLIGGWDIDTEEELLPGLICGIYVFCRYLEQENEVFIV